MRWILALIIGALLLAGAASAHRMFVGQQITVDLFVFYDDGSPAANSSGRRGLKVAASTMSQALRPTPIRVPASSHSS